MASMPKGQPKSVADPDGQAYDEMIRQHKALVSAREGRTAPQSSAARISGAADIAGNVLAAGEIAPAAVAAASNAAEDLEAARSVARFAGPVGKLLSIASQSAGFKADRAVGMPLDEAFIKHAGGVVLGVAGQSGGAAIGSIAGVPGGPGGVRLGAATVGYLGGKDGEFLAEDLAHAWHGVKQLYGQARDGFNHTMSRLNDPSAYVRPRDGL